MSKFLLNLALSPTKALITAYTWSTLPFYAAIQRPWRRLALSRALGVKQTLDPHGRGIIYTRPSPHPEPDHHPLMKCHSLSQMIPHLDPAREVVGVRPVLDESPAIDPKTGRPVRIEGGRELKKLTLAPAFRWYTVREILDRVDALAKGLATQLGVKPGDKVCLYAENSFEWLCTTLALQRLNAMVITLLSIMNNDGLIYCLNQCGARHLITSEDLLLKRIRSIHSKINHPISLIYIENFQARQQEEVKACIQQLTTQNDAKISSITSYDQIQRYGAEIRDFTFPNPKINDPTLIMYTSGTTGRPKGVLFTHKQIAAKLHNYIRYDQGLDHQILGSSVAAYLPMAHIIGYILNLALFAGQGRVALCSPMTLFDSSPFHASKGQLGDLRLAPPEYMGGVPLMLDRILAEINRTVEARGPFAAALFHYLLDYKIRWKARGFDTPIINRLVCDRIRRAFGGKLKIMMAGSAPLSEQTQARVQAALNVHLLQGYGSTEVTGGSHMMIPQDLTVGESGVPFHSVRYYLKAWPEGGYSPDDQPNPRGEIVVGGDIVAEGYYLMLDETKEAFKMDPDGVRWFESGDIGEVLPNGTLKIIDRKKDLVKLSNGEFVALGKIESGYRSLALVENICVCNHAEANYVTALVSPNHSALAQLARSLSKDSLTIEQQCEDPEIVSIVLKLLQESGAKLGLAPIEIPRRICLVPEEWTAESGLLTPAMKMKRKQVRDQYRKQIEQSFI